MYLRRRKCLTVTDWLQGGLEAGPGYRYLGDQGTPARVQKRLVPFFQSGNLASAGGDAKLRSGACDWALLLLNGLARRPIRGLAKVDFWPKLLLHWPHVTRPRARISRATDLELDATQLQFRGRADAVLGRRISSGIPGQFGHAVTPSFGHVRHQAGRQLKR